MTRHTPPRLRASKTSRSVFLKRGSLGQSIPPNSPTSLSAGHKPPAGLTPIFNAAAKRPQINPPTPYAKQISNLEAMMSAPKREPHLTPANTGPNAPRPERDKEIVQRVSAIHEAKAIQRAKIQNDFSKARIKGNAKRAFRKIANRM